MRPQGTRTTPLRRRDSRSRTSASSFLRANEVGYAPCVKRKTVIAPHGEALKSLLIRVLGVVPSAADRLLGRGAVYVDGKRVHEGRVLNNGERITIVLEESGASTDAAATSELRVTTLFEDVDVIVVDKPAGLPAQPTPGGAASLLDVVSKQLGFTAGLVHRLDRETSGVTIFGKHPDATSALAAAFRDGLANKRYLAVTAPGLPEAGTITLPLSKDPSRPARWRASTQANGLTAHTNYQRLFCGDEFSLVALTPLTGRTHQLRAHLAGIGWPIIGDTLYGGLDSAPRCLLHAQRLEISGEAFEAPIPADLGAYFDRAGLAVN